MKKFLSILAIILTLILALNSIALAYSFAGWKWRTASGTYRRDASMNWVDTCSGAASNWKTAGFLLAESSSATPYVTIYKDHYALATWSGRSSCTKDGFGYVTGGYIEINTKYTDNYNWTERKGLITHEMGHTIGLNHSYAVCIMYPYDSERHMWSVYEPCPDDINGVNALY